MAHSDYDCCAVCDRKLGYGGGEYEAKEFVCDRCVYMLAARGVTIAGDDVATLLAWMRAQPAETVVRVLTECGFRTCYYANDVDGQWEALMKSEGV